MTSSPSFVSSSQHDRLHTRSLAVGVLAALAAVLIGSGWQIVSRHGVTTSLGPVELAVLRYGIPALLLAPTCCRCGCWPTSVPKGRQVAGPVVGATTGLHANQAGGQVYSCFQVVSPKTKMGSQK